MYRKGKKIKLLEDYKTSTNRYLWKKGLLGYSSDATLFTKKII
jgi:hypothetical protein